MAKKWRLKSGPPDDFYNNFPLMSRLMATLLFHRGFLGAEEVDRFLLPAYGQLHDPFLFPDMEKAVKRVWKAIENSEKIAVYGDYDADAVTANAVLQQTFQYLGVEALSYIPDRFTEGYGLNIEAFQKLFDQGVNIVITVDCGTNSVDVAEFCKSVGIDLIITDHHEITGEVPDSFALINPKRPGEPYPDKQITGVGVAFKFVQALLSPEFDVEKRRLALDKPYIPGWEKWLLDLVSIGTVADCHSLMGENRIFVKFGLQVLSKSRWLGLKSLVGLASPPERGLNSQTLGFGLAPRINAAGRLEHANVALQLLTSKDVVEADQLALRLNDINTRRQELTARMVSEAAEEALLQQDRPILVLSNTGWAKGVVGLVAGRLAEQFTKPVIALSQGDEESTGSARSVGSFDMVECLKASKEYLVRFGGHKQAAGLTVATHQLSEFKAAVWKYGAEYVRPEDMESVLELDAEIDSVNFTIKTADDIELLEPFGFGNPKPKLLLRDCIIRGMRLVGKEEKHVQLQLEKGDKVIGVIGFNMPHLAKNFNTGDTVHAAGEIQKDSWNGREQLKLRLLDLKPAHESIY